MSDQAAEAVARSVGRPSDYTQELADRICDKLAGGQSLRAICRENAFPGQTTVFRWLAANKDFREQYARARETQADAIADEILTIADEAEDAAKARLQVDARKWLAGKLRPKVYGDRITHAGDTDAPLETVTRIELVAPRVNSAD